MKFKTPWRPEPPKPQDDEEFWAATTFVTSNPTTGVANVLPPTKTRARELRYGNRNDIHRNWQPDDTYMKYQTGDDDAFTPRIPLDDVSGWKDLSTFTVNFDKDHQYMALPLEALDLNAVSDLRFSFGAPCGSQNRLTDATFHQVDGLTTAAHAENHAANRRLAHRLSQGRSKHDPHRGGGSNYYTKVRRPIPPIARNGLELHR